MISGSALWISFNSASTEIKGIGVSQNQTPFQKPQLLSSVISWSRAASWLPRGVVFVQMVSVLSTGPSLSIKDQSSLPLQSHQYLKVVSATLGIWVSHQVGLSTFPSSLGGQMSWFYRSLVQPNRAGTQEECAACCPLHTLPCTVCSCPRWADKSQIQNSLNWLLGTFCSMEKAMEVPEELDQVRPKVHVCHVCSLFPVVDETK